MSLAGVEVVRRQSATHGWGVYAAGPIARGTPVFTYRGPLLHADEVTPDTLAMQVGPELFIGPCDDPEDLQDYVNHCCEPNLGFAEGTLTIYALRDIAAGEELFWDYSTSMNEPGWELTCGCGAPACRGKVQSFCDLPEDIKDKLRPIALAYLR